MSQLKAMKSIYCYFFPEVRPIIHFIQTNLPDSMFLVTTPFEKVREHLKPLFNPPLDIPATSDGKIDLDNIHIPIIKRIVKVYSILAPGLRNFSYSYPTSGSSEGLFHLLAELRTKGIKTIYVLNGDYERYAVYAEHLSMKVNNIDLNKTELRDLELGVWFISNPSARDGNIISNEFIRELCEFGHKIVLDLAYVGTTKPHTFYVGHENIIAVAMSFSKPYGVFRFRIGGFIFSREELPSLFGNKWFKDTVRLLQALKIAETIGPTKLYQKYRPMQEKIIANINREYGLCIKPSDSFLMSYISVKDTHVLNETQAELIAPFRRSDNYRFCLTPYFEDWENQITVNHT
jgi:hypothetical protein